MPRVRDTERLSFEEIAPRFNWLLMLVTLGLTVGFGKSDDLASAYGIAVSATMLRRSSKSAGKYRSESRSVP